MSTSSKNPTVRPTAVQAPADNAVYLRNMHWLWRWDMQLAVRIDAVADTARIPVQQTRSGEWTVAVPTPDGTKVYLHSRYDPVAEADKLVAGLDFQEQHCFIVGGFGMGYHLKAIHAGCGGQSLIIVCESSIELIATALAHVDLSDVMADGKLVILTDPDKARLHARCKPHTAYMMLGAKFVPHPPSQRVDGDFHSQMRALVTDFVAYSRMSVLTLLANSEITCRNIAHNLARYVTTPPINILRQRFAGNPAIVVSAGPSLRKNISQLARAKGRAVICAAQTTLKPLLEHDIRPDFVTSLDFHEMSAQFFQGADGLDDIHLVAEPKATWHVVDQHPGPLSLLDNEFARLLIGDDVSPSDALPAGATVAHLAFYLACYMGCDPIIFVGQDLAFTGHVFYIPGVEIHRTWQSELNRFNTMEGKEWERIARNRPILRKVPSHDGQELYTDELLATYLEQFEKDFGTTSARIINATEGGARIRGTETMTLCDALDRFCTEPIDKGRFAYRKTQRWFNPAKLPIVRDRLRSRATEIEEIENICVQMLELLTKLQGLTDRPDEFNRLIVRVDELRARIHRSRQALHIINASSQLADLRRFSADQKLGVAGQLDEIERTKRQLARDVEFVTSTRDAAGRMCDILAESLTRVENVMSAGDPE